ncbi:hypothetical protein [Azospirillum sp. SYSU D00513]|uniref:hypothetical protein n=1 Tax=Azospirillum sp. SYSU D00513 TaxID=2812561 RepID=UPI001A97A682|nr:hypothetical protein [Azospirillum sp. SYSU D00513]
MMRQRAADRTSTPVLRRAAAAVLAVLIAGAALPAAAAEPAKAAAKPAKAAAKPAAAKGSAACYSPEEHAAEQLLRMHTEMMVVGLKCQTLMPDRKPFSLYQDFTIKHRALVSNSEAAMIAHFKKQGGNATRAFDTFRTELANESSRRAAVIGEQLFCGTFIDRSKAATQLTPEDLRTLTGDEKNAGLMHISTKPLCGVQVVSFPDPPVQVAQAPAARTTAPAKDAAKKAPAKKEPAAAKKPAAKPAVKKAEAPAGQSVASR